MFRWSMVTYYAWPMSRQGMIAFCLSIRFQEGRQLLEIRIAFSWIELDGLLELK